MVEEPVQRRLVAILAADVVGYSRLMEQDEAGTLSALKARRRDILGPLVAKHRGRVVKVMGDGVLVDFSSAVDAVQCAIGLSQGFLEANQGVPEARRIVLRIGVNLGDVIVEGGDLYGEGVNVATRLEQLAEAGGICVSQSVYDQVKRKIEAAFDDLGSQSVKNMAEPVTVYRVRLERDAPVQQILPLPAKPSIAVLPFSNMSNDPEQETFADGLTEDLITDLSRSSGLFVIARNSTFAYKGKSMDVRRIAGDLGVRYLLEGSARRAAGRVRINVQLIDAVAGNHLWAERYDRGLEDMFAVQDEVTAKIVEALVGRLTTPPPRNRPKSLEAYDLCVRARFLNEESPQASHEALVLLKRAIELDPGYAEAHRWLAMNRWLAWAHWGEPEDPTRAEAVQSAEKAVALDPNDAGCRWVLGTLLAYERRWAESDEQYARALELDPNHADAWAGLSDLSVLSGRLSDGLEQIQKAFRLNPYPAQWYYLVMGQAQYALRQYEAAVQTLRHEATYRTHSRRFLAASLAQLGRLDEARREGELFLLINPHFRVSGWAANQPFRDQA
ncbi:MAG: adenylate/guanylate cyclase domain-containing protein, partial [Dongiaceae bacterium]